MRAYTKYRAYYDWPGWVRRTRIRLTRSLKKGARQVGKAVVRQAMADVVAEKGDK